jgi:hypothetical protein
MRAQYSTQSRALAWLLAGISLLVCSDGFAQDLRLNIPPISIDENGKMEFNAIRVDSQDITSDSDIGETEHCRFYRGKATGSYDSDLRLFRYDLLVKDTFKGHDTWSHFELKAIPNGEFLDQVQNVNVTVNWGQIVERGRISLPLHSLSNAQYLSATLDADITDVRLGADKIIPVNLVNKLAAMKLLVQSVRISYADLNFWSNPPSSLSPNLILDEQGTVLLEGLAMRANPTKAIPTTFFRSKNTEDTRLNLAITYSAQSGGKPKELPLLVKIRFVPSLPYLAFVLILGSLLGTLGRLIDERQRKINAWVMATCSAIAAALILEVIAIALVSLDSEFKIFGIVLDPFQIPQVTLLGLLVGLFGINIAITVRGILDKKTSGRHAIGTGASR